MPTLTTTPDLTRSADGTAISYRSLGAGRDILVVGGAWTVGDDYLPFARALAQSFAVHIIDRRGHGQSGPQGLRYNLEVEIEDLLAVRAQTGADIVFGHSYGGLIALEAARRSEVFSDVVVYEPAVSINGSIPLGWMPRYRTLLAAGDRRGAFAAMVRGAEGAPALLEHMPLWYVKLILRLFIKEERWQHMDPLLEAAVAEHEQVAAFDQLTLDRYRTITARVALLGGGKSRARFTTTLFDQLVSKIPRARYEVIAGLDHTAPDDKAPGVVADRVQRELTEWKSVL